ncbi:MAG: helix-turn-helix transcriptional regulator [Planctomycetia bacterium]|nr:helix-turn-helix transcriptional regulator [Planctomycetia bacterium]
MSPRLPKPDADGHYPAVEYARVSLARKIIRDRVAAGLSQRQLALRAGIRVETLCRIETGKHTPSVPTIDKLDRALKAAEQRPRRRTRRSSRKSA